MSAFIKQEAFEDMSSYQKCRVKQEPVETPEDSESQPKGLPVASNRQPVKSVLMSLLMGDDDDLPTTYKKKEQNFKAPRVKKEPKESRSPCKSISPRKPQPSYNDRFYQEQYLQNVYWQEYCKYLEINWYNNYDVMRRYYGMAPVVVPETAHPSWRQSISPMTGYCSGYSSDSSSSF